MVVPSVARRLPARGNSVQAARERWQAARATITPRTQRLARRALEDPRLLLWQLVTFPLWLGSGIPTPPSPTLRGGPTVTTDDAAPARYLAGHLHALCRRFWLAWICSAVLRGVTIGTAISAIWVIGGAAGILSPPGMRWIVTLIIASALLGLGFGLVTRPGPVRVAAMLDRTFELDERLTTAVDPTLNDSRTADNRMRRLQLADAANAFADIRAEIRGVAILPVREGVLAALALILLIAALLLTIAGTRIPATSDMTVPAFIPSAERFARQQQEAQAQQQAALAKPQPPAKAGNASTGSAASDLATVGQALSGQPVTKPASESIAAGDYPSAAQSLRDNAEKAGDLPQDERDKLADELDRAASNVSSDNPDLAEKTKQAASDLRAGGEQATQGMNDLADQIDKTGEKASTEQNAADQQSSSASSQQSAPSSSQPSSNGASNNQSASTQQQPSTSSQQQQGQAPQQGQQSDPGSGMAAQPGIGSDPQQGEAGQQGGQQQSGDQPANSTQTGAQPGAGSQQPANSGSTNGQEGDTGSTSAANGAQSGAPSDSSGSGSGDRGETTGGPPGKTNASPGTGSGAGAGQTTGSASGTDEKPGQSSSTGGDQNGRKTEIANQGEAGDPPPAQGPQGGEGSGNASAQSGGQSLVLQGTSDETVGAGNDTGTSSSGSGAGAGVAAGNQTQGQVGPAGPDSNHVPDEYRDIVKNYFDRDGISP